VLPTVWAISCRTISDLEPSAYTGVKMPAHDLCGHFSRTTCERGTAGKIIIREAKPGCQVRDLRGIIKTNRECKHDAVNMAYEPRI
jgi:hypothetical protein